MQPWLFILVNVAIAAFVGGLTNFYAIKMLFHPRNPVELLGRRVPFTPGLIPKRKSQIAEALGDVVASYLVTAEGLQELLEDETFRDGAKERLTAGIRSFLERDPDMTVRSLALDYWTEEEWRAKKTALAGFLRDLSRRGITYVWKERGLAGQRLGELIPDWSDERVERLSASAEEMIVQALRQEIVSPRGQRMLRDMASGVVDRAGGFLGALAGIFMDEDKTVQRLTPFLIEQLGSDTVRGAIRGMIGRQIREAAGWTVEEAVSRAAGGQDPLQWLKIKAGTALRFEEWFGELEQDAIGRRLLRYEHVWTEWVKRGVDGGLGLLGRQMPAIVRALSLPKLVKQQVEKFPIERLEHIILSVSGKEFKAITWLGAVLGGIIGLIQSMLLLAFGS